MATTATNGTRTTEEFTIARAVQKRMGKTPKALRVRVERENGIPVSVSLDFGGGWEKRMRPDALVETGRRIAGGKA
mgnify:FL=1